MAKLNRYGEVCGGVAGGWVSAKGVLYGKPGGGTNWLTDDTIIYQVYREEYEQAGLGNHGWLIESTNIRTGERKMVANRGANHIIAGGGRWCAWLGDAETGVYGALESSVAGIAAAGRDGTLGIIPDYQSGLGILLYAPNGEVTAGPADQPCQYGLQILGPDSAIWTDRGIIQGINAAAPKQAAHAWNGIALNIGGEDWITYFTEDYGQILHPYNELSGYVVEPGPHVFWPDAIVVDNRIRVAFSWTQGETIESIRVLDFDITKPRTTFVKTSWAVPAPEERIFTASTSANGVVSANTSALVQPQLGLLEDDIVYRLSLLAVNVLQPIKNKYPNIVVKSGFRQTNTGIGQHELGEAVDLQINNQTTQLLYEVAAWIRDHLNFDQLILNFTRIGDGQPWIHVSFSPKALRGQVLTKDFADTFHEGLFIVQDVAGEAAAAILREQAEMDKQIMAEMQKIQRRQKKLVTVTTVLDDGITAGNTTPFGSSGGRGGSGGSGGRGGDGSGSSGGNGGGNRSASRVALVDCIAAALGIDGGGSRDGREDFNSRQFDITKRVAWMLRDEHCGLLVSNESDSVSWNGYAFSPNQVCYPDGTVVNILTDGRNYTGCWSTEGVLDDSSRYVPAMDPGSEYNVDWLSCPVPGQSPSSPGAPGPGNDGSGVDAFDLSSVASWTDRSGVAIGAGMTSWPKTSSITGASVTADGVSFPHTQAGSWGTQYWLEGDAEVEANVWVFVKIDGKWCGGVGEWVRPGQTNKGPLGDYSGDMSGTYYDATDTPLRDHILQPGEEIGLMVTTPCRSGDALSSSQIKARSNVVLVRYSG